MEQHTTIYLVRHGQTMLNLLDRAQGWSDSPLTPAGRDSAACLGQALGREGVRFVSAWSSDSGRAIETARLILQHSGQEVLPLNQDPRLREWCLGHMEGGSNREFLTALRQLDGAPFPLDQLDTHLPQVADYIHQHLDRIGMSQPFDQIAQRLTNAFHDLAQDAAEKGGDALVVSHGLSIKTLIFLLARDRLEEVSYLKNTSVCRFSWDGVQFCPLALNDVHYLSQ